MKALKYLSIIGIIILVNSCASVRVKTLYDQNTDFGKYKTFCWFSGCEFTIQGPSYLKKDSATVELFKTAIVDQLEQKGFTQNENNPDFLLFMHIVVEEREGRVLTPYDLYDEYDRPYYILEGFGPQTYIYLRGSMIIDIADAKSSEMIWRSDAVQYMDIYPDITEKKVARGIKRALKKFPPTPNL